MEHDKKAIAALVLGIVSLIVWLLPLFGYPVSIIGIIMGIKSKDSNSKTFALVGLILSIIGLAITVANSAIGAFMMS